MRSAGTDENVILTPAGADELREGFRVYRR